MNEADKQAVVDLLFELSEERRLRTNLEGAFLAHKLENEDDFDSTLELAEANVTVLELGVQVATKLDKDIRVLSRSDVWQWGVILATAAAAFSALVLVLLK